ncbi:hypothetical protein D3C76_1457030 [compost metagenome]
MSAGPAVAKPDAVKLAPIIIHMVMAHEYAQGVAQLRHSGEQAAVQWRTANRLMPVPVTNLCLPDLPVLRQRNVEESAGRDGFAVRQPGQSQGFLFKPADLAAVHPGITLQVG